MTDTTTQPDLTVEVGAQTSEELWEEVLQHAPAMGRLPDMVVALFDPEKFPDAAELRETEIETRQQVQQGIVLYYQLLGAQVLNSLFENHSNKFGAGLQVVMEKLIVDGEEAGKNYTLEQLCGWLLAGIAIEYSRQAVDEGDVLWEGDPGVQYALFFTYPPYFLSRLRKSFRFADEAQTERAYSEARGFILGFGMAMIEPDVTTVYH